MSERFKDWAEFCEFWWESHGGVVKMIAGIAMAVTIIFAVSWGGVVSCINHELENGPRVTVTVYSGGKIVQRYENVTTCRMDVNYIFVKTADGKRLKVNGSYTEEPYTGERQ